VRWLQGVLLLSSGGLPIATASPPDAPPGTAFADSCPLRRIGTQLVRCDKLTGSGVRAPSWIPELTSRADEKRILEAHRSTYGRDTLVLASKRRATRSYDDGPN
jgi:hypothetical protein